MRQCGKVWLVGAGPGEEGLLTVKAKSVINEADVIVYDALVSMEILSQIPNGKEMIYAGKRSGNHALSQSQLNELLRDEALKGKKVCRLKGGDPFVFGRGGEELEVLCEAGVPFEVVPGITSAVAVPAYAGIPVTHRDFVSSFHVITAHPRKDGNSRIDFEALVRCGGTLVFLMGVSSLKMICDGLMEAGMDKTMPAAVLEKGTTARQRKVVSVLSKLVEDVKKAEIETPAIIVVGEVCKLSSKLSWSEERPLGGRRFLLTRPEEHISVLAQKLRNLGAQVMELPAIETCPLDPKKDLKSALEQIEQRKTEVWAVFTSPIGVDTFFEQIRSLKFDIRRLFCSKSMLRIAAIGSGTGLALEKYGLFPDVIPEDYYAKALGEAVAKAAKPGSEVFLFRAEKGSPELIPPMKEKGLVVHDIPIYETQYRTYEPWKEQLEKMILNGEIDAVTFTSGSTVKGFVETFGGLREELSKNINAVCIGEQTAAQASKYNMQIHISKKATMYSLVEKIVELYGRKDA